MHALDTVGMMLDQLEPLGTGMWAGYYPHVNATDLRLNGRRARVIGIVPADCTDLVTIVESPCGEVAISK